MVTQRASPVQSTPPRRAASEKYEPPLNGVPANAAVPSCGGGGGGGVPGGAGGTVLMGVASDGGVGGADENPSTRDPSG